MHSLSPFIQDLTIMLGVASLVTLLFQRIHQPVVLGYLVAGMLIGPHTTPWHPVTNTEEVAVLSELGVIFLMFSLGLDFTFHRLKRVGFSAAITGLIDVSVVTLTGIVTGLLLHWSFHESLFLGAALAISSTTIIIKALDELDLRRKRFAEFIFGILIMEDLLAILLLVGLSTLVATRNFFSMNMLVSMGKLLFVVGGWFLVGYFLVPGFMRRITRFASEETLTIVSIALCLLLVVAATRFGYSPALGAFIMGSIMAETPFAHRIEQLIRPIRDIFAAVFFVSVGMLIDPHLIWQSLPVILLITVIYIVSKVTATTMGAFLTGQSPKTSVRIGCGVAQIGEFSFIIAGLGVSLGVTGHHLYPIIVAISVLTAFTTPLLLRFSGWVAARLDVWLPANVRIFLDNYSAWVYRTLASSGGDASVQSAVVRTLLNGIVVALVFTAIQYLFLPAVMSWFTHPWVARLTAWGLAMLAASPFIWGMMFSARPASGRARRRDVLFRQMPRIIASLATILEVAVLSMAWFHNWLTGGLLLGVVIVFFVMAWRMLDRSYHWFEHHLIRNVSHHAAQEARYSQLSPWDTHFSEVIVGEHSPLAGQALAHAQLREKYGINIVAICHEGRTVLAPRGEAIVMPQDRLVVLGNDEQIDAFEKGALRAVKNREETPREETLSDFSLKALVLDGSSPFVGKTIRASGVREQVSGMVVGLERGEKRLLNPDPAMLLQTGDLLLLVGETKQLEAGFSGMAEASAS